MSDKVIKSKYVTMVAKTEPLSSQSLGSRKAEHRDLLSKPQQVLSGNFHVDQGEKISAKTEDYERGLADGIAFQKKEQLQAVNALSDIIKNLGQLKEQFYVKVEGEMLNLVFSIAEKIIFEEVSTNRKVVQKVIKEAVKNVVDGDGMNIRVNPQDYRSIMEIKHEFLQELSRWKNVTLEEDAGIMPGGAVLETTSGEVDARVEHQLKEIQTALKIR